MSLSRLALIASVLTGVAAGQLGVVGSASAAPGTSPAGLARVSSASGAIEYGYRYVRQDPSRVTGPLELGGVLDLVDLTIDGFTCSADEPFVDPACGTHTVAVAGTAQKHPSAAQPVTPKYPVTGSCAMPFSSGKATVFISCALHVGDNPRELGMTVRVIVGGTLGTGDLISWCDIEPPTVCNDPLPAFGTDYGSIYQQR